MAEQTVPFPYEFTELEGDAKDLTEETLAANPIELVRVGPKGYIVYKPYIKDAENIYNMPLRPSDVFVASYQRSGTTMTQELVWLLLNELDYEKAQTIPLVSRYEFLEPGESVWSREILVATTSATTASGTAYSDKLFKRGAGDACPPYAQPHSDQFMLVDQEKKDILIEYLKKEDPNFDADKMLTFIEMMRIPASIKLASTPSPRFIKTHLPMTLLHPKLLETAKMVYIAREPKDVAVSCYHHSLLFKMQKFSGGFKQFWNLFHQNLFVLTPYFEHVKEAWNLRHHPNMLFLFYEDVTKDMPTAIRRIGSFFGKTLTEEQIAVLCDHLSIKNFKENKSVNLEDMRDTGIVDPKESFIRKGKAGGWREYFDEEMTQQAERWMADNLRDTDLRFPNV